MKYISLKNLLNELNLIYEKDSSHSYKSLKEMYFLIGKNIIPNEEITDLPIQEIISGKGGVCRDIVSTYYPLLDYYGFDAGFKFGISNKILHTWLSMNLNGDYFELDPSWYSNYMIPLEKRLKEHNLGSVASTSRRKPLKLVYFEGYISEKEARHREQNLKLRARALRQLLNRIKLSVEG